jgi:hypothetical protein
VAAVLHVRVEQLVVLRATARVQFSEELALVLREAYPAETVQLSEAALVEIVAAGVQRSHAWGLLSDRAVGDFASLWLQLGDDFDLHPAVRAVLEDVRVPTADRVTTLMQRLTPEDWRAVAERG